MANLSQYITPAIAAVATAASLASATIAQKPPAPPEPTNQLTAAEKKAGWILLFDGKSLNGWHGYKKPDTTGTRWQVEDGLLTVNPGNGTDTRGALDIITAVQFDRFDLTWEWRIAEGGNSGLKYFVLEDLPSAIGHEYQLIDDERHADAKVGPHRQTAALYDVLPAQNRPLKPAGQFNQSRIVSNGTTVEHYLNGTRVLQYELDSPALREAIAKSKFKDVARFGKLQNGFILLQDHGDRVWYRNIKIRKLPAAPSTASAKGMKVVADEAGRRVDITIDGKPFTSYIYPETLKKPVLYPLRTANGTLVTRGFPLDPRPRERFDHPHHVGLWFNHGDVNGLDFWNNSNDIPADRAPKMGTIRHKRVIETKSGADRGELAVEMDWLTADGTAILRETTRFVFRGGDSRSIDRITTLTALDRQCCLSRQQGRVARPSRDAGARAAGREAGALHRRQRKGNEGSCPRQHWRHGLVHEQRRAEGRRGLGNARPLVHARRKNRRGARHYRDTRPSLESQLPHLLARAGIRPVLGQRVREEGLRSETGRADRDARTWEVADVPPSRADPEHGDTGIGRARVQDVRGRRLVEQFLTMSVVVGRGVVEGHLAPEEVADLARQGLERLPVDGKRVIVLIPDGTRTMPMPLMFDILERELGPRVAALDFLVALGTHTPMSDEQLSRLVGRTVVDGRAGDRRIFNHRWDDPATFATLGTIPASHDRGAQPRPAEAARHGRAQSPRRRIRPRPYLRTRLPSRGGRVFWRHEVSVSRHRGI